MMKAETQKFQFPQPQPDLMICRISCGNTVAGRFRSQGRTAHSMNAILFSTISLN